MFPIYADIDETGKQIVLFSGTKNDGSYVAPAWSDKPLITMIPGKTWDAKRNVYTLPLAWSACIQARAILGDRLKVGNPLAAWSRTEKARRDEVMHVRAARELVEDDFPDTEVLRGMREDV
jgi:hypothetical protein